jgi:hypothetical protein
VKKIQISGSLIFILLLVCCILFSSCRKENSFDCFKGNGEEVTQVRIPGEFSSVDIYDKMEVTVSRGSEYNVSVTAGKNIIKNITTSVHNGTLNIRNMNTCNFVRGYKKTIRVHVTLPYLKRITNNSVGPVYFTEGFTQDTLVIRAESSGDIHVKGSFNEIRSSSHGNGDVYLKGTCNSLVVYAYGTNFLFADSLSVKNYMFIHSVTYGDCHVNVSGLNVFEYNILRDGNIYYRGTPGVITDFSEPDVKGKAIRVD